MRKFRKWKPILRWVLTCSCWTDEDSSFDPFSFPFRGRSPIGRRRRLRFSSCCVSDSTNSLGSNCCPDELTRVTRPEKECADNFINIPGYNISKEWIIIIIIIIIALGNAPYKMLHKLKSAYSIRKNQLWTSASSSVSQKSKDQLSDPLSQQATHSNSSLHWKKFISDTSCINAMQKIVSLGSSVG